MSDLSALEEFIGSHPDARELKRALAVKMTLGSYPGLMNLPFKRRGVVDPVFVPHRQV